MLQHNKINIKSQRKFKSNTFISIRKPTKGIFVYILTEQKRQAKEEHQIAKHQPVKQANNMASKYCSK